MLCVSGAGVKFGSLGGEMGELGELMKLNHEEAVLFLIPRDLGKCLVVFVRKQTNFQGTTAHFDLKKATCASQ